MSVNRRLQRWVTAPVESIFLQLPRALVVSVLALALDIGLYEFLFRLGLDVVPAAVIGYLAGGVVQYVLCSWWVFSSSPGNYALGFVTFTVLSLVGLGITCVVVYVLHDLCNVNELVAKLAAVGLAFTWNFLSRKYLLFTSKATSNVAQPLAAEAAPSGEVDACAASLL
jgi:putative flippase GtrA